ncbi:glycoside hydrolase family 9 protein [Blautia schinkii]|nr:glycoside hydrolase family 9 protein [Blautia schinkii]
MGKILICHIGYQKKEKKIAIYQGDGPQKNLSFEILDDHGNTCFSGTSVYQGKVVNWNKGVYWTMDFTEFEEPGEYYISLATEEGKCLSSSFEIGNPYIKLKIISDLGCYFKSQRVSGEWEYADKAISFQGNRQGTMNLSGGWYDATGDYGVHMSHLSHSAWYNPQQAGFSAYAFFQAAEILQMQGSEQYSMVIRRLYDEGTFGADFIMRMRAPSGSFFRSKCRDRNAFLSPQGTRKIEYEYRTFSTQFNPAQDENSADIADENYETSFRSGAGTAIAALAIAARHPYPGSEFSSVQYLSAAETAFKYLWSNNERYTNNGRWNLIDEYCALLAAVEIYKSSAQYEYLLYANKLSEKIISRIYSNKNREWLYVDKKIPYHHPSDEGLPVTVLLLYAGICKEPEKSKKIISVCEKLMKGKIAITKSCVNPFLYPRFEYIDDNGERELFFFPHNTTASPWWQGENARIASLAAAARMLGTVTKDSVFAKDLFEFSDAQLQWIFGRNPYDSCMMEGYGRNRIQYFFHGRYDFLNSPGGVVNGITSALNDEDGIEFIQKATDEVDDNWRWAEQWLPHASWLLVAMAADNK